jgi:hypothetical protein
MKKTKLLKMASIIETALLKMETTEEWIKGIVTNPVWAGFAVNEIDAFIDIINTQLGNQMQAYSDRVNKYVPVVKELEIEVTSYEGFVREYITNDSNTWQDELQGLYYSTMFRLMSDTAELLIKEIGFDIDLNKFDIHISNFLETKSIKWAQQVNQTTEKAVREFLVKGYEEGRHFTEIAQEIKDLPAFSINRAITVARTEILGATNHVDFYYNVNTGIYYAKKWRTSLDESVRKTHQLAEGQVVLINEAFNVGGFQLMYPGDTEHGAPAEEIINCRCGLEYLTQEEYNSLE